jgi:hypothetical protein
MSRPNSVSALDANGSWPIIGVWSTQLAPTETGRE